MKVTVNRIRATHIDDGVITRVLGIYSEEELIKRPIFQNALRLNTIEFSTLRSECEKILIPWQLFFLSKDKLEEQMRHIEEQREHKISKKLLAKRRGQGDVTSKRVIDRLIRQQNFLTKNGKFPENVYCGSLARLSPKQAVSQMVNYFNVDRNQLWNYGSKGRARDYLLRQVEAKNINVSRGVLTNKILPTWQVVPSDVYRNTSGFVIQDKCVPFIFLPSEVANEVESREIYTLIYLLVVIGLGQYEFYLDKDFKVKMLQSRGMTARIHKITTEFLIPESETEVFRTQVVTENDRDSWSSRLKVSPTAFLITLRMRKIITNEVLENLKPEAYVPPKQESSDRRSPHVSTSVKKFCGTLTYITLNNAIRSKALSSIQAQYLIFGAVNKKGYHKYLKELEL